MPAMKPKVRENLAVVELDGEAVIYDDRNGELHHLNPTATVVFSLLDGTATVKELAAEISEAFGVSTAQVESEVRALIREFRKAELLEGSLPLTNGQPDEPEAAAEITRKQPRAKRNARTKRNARAKRQGGQRAGRRTARIVHG